MTFPWSVVAKGAVEDATELAEALGHLLRKHGATDVSFSSSQYEGDPRDIAAQDADPNAPVEAVPAVADPADVPAAEETRDDTPAITDDEHDPGPVPDGA